jgi:phospholipase D-like protein
VLLADSYPFLSVMWTMLVFFVWVLWFWLLFGVFADIFRRHDLSGWGKAGWLIFVIVLPYLGVFIYLITQNPGMTERAAERANTQWAPSGGGGGGAAAEIEAGKKLLDAGTITQTEFDVIKQKALTA